MGVVKNNWLPFVLGVAFAMWVLPMLTALVSARKSPAAAN